MARKAAVKSAVKTVKTATNDDFKVFDVKALLPKDLDAKYWGPEPEFHHQPESDVRGTMLARGFTWYNSFYDNKEAKTLLIQYLTLHGRTVEAKLIAKVEDNKYRPTLSWLARMNIRGLQLTEHEELTLQNYIKGMVDTVKHSEKTTKKTDVAEKESARPNVQEIMRERTREAAGEIEGMFDEYLKDGAKTNHSFKPVEELAKRNILPQHIHIVVDAWKKKLAEFEGALAGKDKQLNEGYSQYTTAQLKRIIKFIEQFLADFNSYVSVKKANRAPRARKVVPVEKIVAKLKYLKSFKDAATKIDLVSVHPTKLHGASEAWVYDTSKRKLHHYVADEYSKTFSVKGNALIGFDTKNSEVKILRKPAEQIKEIMGSKPAARKYFKDIKAVSTTPNGRFNESMIILKAF